MPNSSQFWENYGGVNNAGGATYAVKVNRDESIMKAAHLLKEKGSRKTARVIRALLGTAVGATALEQFSEVAVQTQFDQSSLGGKRGISTRTIINRATTSADLTLMQRIVDQKFRPATYPLDRSGNGYTGQSKVGTF